MKHPIIDLFKSYPKGLYVLFYTEMWELFGRFGIGSLLVLYVTKLFHFTDDQAFMIYSAYLSLLFVTPIVGGALCDRILGNRHSIILGASIMIAGNVLLIIPKPMMVYLGLSILALGSGFFLPSIAPLVGRLYDHNERGRDAGFTLYYLGRNLGALTAPIFCGIVGEYFGFNYAFILSALGLLSGLIVFIMGQKYIVQYDIKSIKASRLQVEFIYVGSLLVLPLIFVILVKNLDGYLLALATLVVTGVLIVMTAKRSSKERRHIVVILILMAFVVIFESFLNQGGSSLNLFIDRLVNRSLFNVTIPTTVFYAIDPAFMMIIGPILSVFWLYLAKKNK